MRAHTNLRTEEEKEKEQRDPKLETPYVFKYVQGCGTRFRNHDVELSGRGSRYAAVYDLDIAERLMEKGALAGGAPGYDITHYNWLEPGDVESALNRTAEDVIEAVESGRYDSVLDMLAFAEQEAFDERKTVLEAITERSDEIVQADDPEELIEEDTGIDPSTIATI